MNKTVSNFLVGFLAGAAAGAIAGILFAPGKGSETRQNIRNRIRDLSDDFGLGINELIEELGLEAEPVPVATARKPARKASSNQKKASSKPKRTPARKPPVTND